MKVLVGISNRHVHLTEEDYVLLFGTNILEKKKDLYQIGQFASTQTITIRTEKGEIAGVRLLGPFRDYTQVELSKTDTYTLGIDPPIRDSGDLEGASLLELVGPKGTIQRECAILPNRHIHISPDDLKKIGLREDQEVMVHFEGAKGAILEHVRFKVDPSYRMELHLDTDEGNAVLAKTGDTCEIIVP